MFYNGVLLWETLTTIKKTSCSRADIINSKPLSLLSFSMCAHVECYAISVCYDGTIHKLNTINSYVLTRWVSCGIEETFLF